MSYNLGKRDRPDDNGYGPPQKRMVPSQQQSYGGSSYGGPPPSGPPQGRMGSSYDSSYSSPPSMQQQPPHQQQHQSQHQPRITEEKPSCVLLFTVFNPKYPITVDVMQTICSANGAQVNRIVIFRKNGVQAMVEFDSIESAEAVKESLQGADIYSGCCTLKIDWGKPTRLTVTKNDQDSWDYTAPAPSAGQDKQQPLLPDPKFGPGPGASSQYPGASPYPPQGQYGDRRPPGGGDYGYDDYRAPPRGDQQYDRPSERYPPPGPPGQRPPYDPYGPPRDSYGPPSYGHPPRGPPGMRPPYPGGMPPRGDRPPAGEYDDGSGNGAMLQQGSVMMVYGLNNEKINCQKLFNLFCLYGNVVRIKFLKSKDGVAMVQMGDYGSCERASQNLSGSFLFGQKIMIGFSKQAFIQDVPNPVDLPDGTPSFKDFMGNRNNRFTTPEAAAKNRIHSASKILYFFNSPPGLKEEDMKQIFIDAGVKEPAKVKIFPAKSEKSSTGLLEWDNKGDCIEALVAANHTPLPNPSGKNPYVIKFCFSDVPIKGQYQHQQ